MIYATINAHSIPNSCADCELRYEYEQCEPVMYVHNCGITNNGVEEFVNTKTKSADCPLVDIAGAFESMREISLAKHKCERCDYAKYFKDDEWGCDWFDAREIRYLPCCADEVLEI